MPSSLCSICGTVHESLTHCPVQMPRAVQWEFSDQAPEESGTAVRNTPCDLGREVGSILADMAERGAAIDRRKFPHAKGPCRTCAFRRGSFPNGCLTTTADALKCVIETVPFYCHEDMNGGHPSRLCEGWAHAVSYAASPDGEARIAFICEASRVAADLDRADAKENPDAV